MDRPNVDGQDVPQGSRLETDAEGTISVPAFKLPLSAGLSPESREAQKAMMAHVGLGTPSFEGHADRSAFKHYVEGYRRDLDAQIGKPFSRMLAEKYPVDIVPGTIAGVAVEEFTPRHETVAGQVLINLHGGAFLAGAKYIGRVESIPVAHLGGYRVVSVDYRQAPEHCFPAASEDVEAVYRALLEDYAPQNIGIYGGSAGAMLTAQVTAWLLEKGLPAPGAIGIFGAGAGGTGDSTFFGPIGVAERPPSNNVGPGDHWVKPHSPLGYFAGAAADDYLAFPQKAPRDLLARFPPTLLITATRAFDMSPAILFHRALMQAEVDASLQVFDGLGHCFYYNASTPEAHDAYATILRFFRHNLGRAA